MPIAQIFLSPSAVSSFVPKAEQVTGAVTKALTDHLKPAPQTIQVMLAAMLAPPQGCDVLCIVTHRGSAARNSSVRDAAAAALHDILHAVSGQSVRVRLIAIEGADIAAMDTQFPFPNAAMTELSKP